VERGLALDEKRPRKQIQPRGQAEKCRPVYAALVRRGGDALVIGSDRCRNNAGPSPTPFFTPTELTLASRSVLTNKDQADIESRFTIGHKKTRI